MALQADHVPTDAPRPLHALRRLAATNLGPDRVRPTLIWSLLMVWLGINASVACLHLLQEAKSSREVRAAVSACLPFLCAAVGSLGRRRIARSLDAPGKWFARVTKLIGFGSLGAVPAALASGSIVFCSLVAAAMLISLLPWCRVAWASYPWFLLAGAPLALVAALAPIFYERASDALDANLATMAWSLTVDLLTGLVFVGVSLFWLAYFPIELRTWQRTLEA